MRINLFKSGGNAAGTGGFVSNGLSLQGPLILSGPHTEPLHAVPKQYVDNSAYNLDASHVTSGILPTGRLPAFTGDATNILGSNSFVLSSVGITAGSYIKPTVDAKGRVTAGGTLSDSDIANVAFDKISVGKPTTVSGYGITDAVNTANDTMTGNLTLNADPTNALHAVTKQYVDGAAGGAGGVAVGDIIRKPFTTTPVGFLKCNGALVDKTTYAGLYAVVGDSFASYTTPGSGKPWQLQYDINNTQSIDITGWTTGTSLPAVVTHSTVIVTKNRVYLLGGNTSSTVYTAPINTDGTLGTWTTGTSLPGNVESSQVIVTKNRVYILGSWSSSTVYTAPINSDGTLGTWITGTSLPGTLYWTQAIVTTNRVYLLGGVNNGSDSSITYTAPINSDGTLGTWSVGTSLPGILSHSSVIVTKNRVYLLGGWNGSVVVSTIYTAPINSDGTLGTWTTGTSLPGALGYSQAIVTKGRVYLLGGLNGSSSYVSTVYTAPINSDGTLGTWTTGTSLSTVMSYSQIIITKNRVYILGGYDGSWTSAVYTAPILEGLNDYSAYYTEDTTNYMMPGSGKPWQQQYQLNETQNGDITGWTAGTTLPEGFGYHSVIVTKNRVYTLGGYNFNSVHTAPINTDGTLGTWTTGTALPIYCYSAQAVVTKNRVYLIGIYNIATVYTAPINSDGTLGTWVDSGNSMPSAASYSQSIVTKNRIYVIGGYVTSAVYTAPIDSNGIIGTWTTGNSLPQSVYLSQAIITKNRLYLIGGHNGSSYLSTVYYASISNDGVLGTWFTYTSLPVSIGETQAIVTKNKVYLLGGKDGGGLTATVYYAPIDANGNIGTWTTGTSLPVATMESQAIIIKNRIHLIGGQTSTPVYTSAVYTAPIAGGLNDYSPYYDGTILPVSAPVITTFALPDYVSSDSVLSDNICSYIKY